MTNEARNKNEFLGYLHSFRGFAIMMIVLIHAVGAAFYGAFGIYDITHPIIIINEVLLHDSTIYFALISGLLFTRILSTRGYAVFYKTKFKYIILPYLFFTLVFTALKLNLEATNGWLENCIAYGYEVLVNLIYGKASFVLWYIPVLLFLYAVTPFLDFLLKTNGFTRSLFMIIVLLPLIVTRIQMAQDYILRIETMLYFTGAYGIGMYIGYYLNQTLAWVAKHRFYLIAIVILSSGLLYYLYATEIDMVGTISSRESIFYFQKLCLAVLVICWFKELGRYQPKWFYNIATNSFAIYFMHGYLVYAFLPIIKPLVKWETLIPVSIVIGALLLLLLAIVISGWVVKLFKFIFGKYSRMLVGA